MAIIFGGIDFPVFEILLIISIVLFIGLIVLLFGIYYLLNELKQLKIILIEIRRDVQELEKDIARGESDLRRLEYDIKSIEKFKVNSKKGPAEVKNDLKKYIESNLNKGFAWEHIKTGLVSQGFEHKNVDSMYKRIKK